MPTTLSRSWWIFALRGVFAIIFGILAFIWPQTTLATLVLFFGAYALFDGVFALIGAFQGRAADSRWWVTALEGLVGILVGVMTFVWPATTGLVLLYFIASWPVITGVFEIIAAIQLRHTITNEWLLILSGIASVVFGVLLFVFPGAGALSLVWLIGVYAVIFGVLLIGLALRLRSLPRVA
jgi:uncharacterized membrane protein HdeD (DUF308 family)